MLKQSIIYLILSVIIVLFAHYAHFIIIYLDLFYTWLNLQLAPLFSAHPLGIRTRTVLTLVLLPIGIVAVPALIFRVIKKHDMPYFMEITWLIWLILVLSRILIH